jgi:hypothetical protein
MSISGEIDLEAGPGGVERTCLITMTATKEADASTIVTARICLIRLVFGICMVVTIASGQPAVQRITMYQPAVGIKIV